MLNVVVQQTRNDDSWEVIVMDATEGTILYHLGEEFDDEDDAYDYIEYYLVRENGYEVTFV